MVDVTSTSAILRDKASIKYQNVVNPEVLSRFVFEFKENLIVEDSPLKVSTRTVSGNDLFIMTDDNYGVLGTNKLGDTDLDTEVLQRVVNTNNIYHEHFRDLDYIDTTNTTATIDLINHKITI